MTITYISGFESGSLAVESALPPGNAIVTGSGISIDTGTFRTGSRSLKIIATSGAASHYNSGATEGGSTAFFRFYCRVTVLPATARMLAGHNALNQVWLGLNPDGTLSYNVSTTPIGTSTAALTDTTHWYRIEFMTGPDGTSVTVLWIDGVAQVTGSPSAWTTTLHLGTEDSVAATYTAFFDDVAVSDVNAPIGAGQASLLLPVSDNAIGGWTGGAGGTTNLWSALTSAGGLAPASETNATSVKNVVASATDNLDVNIATYTSAGIGAADTINAIQAVLRSAEHVAAGAATIAVAIVSNPTQTGENTSVPSGLHTADSSTGASTNWGTTRGTTQTGAVTLGTNPVARLGKRTANVKQLCADFLGLYVDWTPAPTAIKTVVGLAKASVKTVDGLAIASVKKMDGLA